MNKVFIINGSPRSGKDTFINFVKTYYPDTINFSSVDFIRWLSVKYLNFNDKVKDAKSRKFLSEFKRILTEYNDFPFEMCCSAIESSNYDSVIFLHIRELSEIEKIKAKYDNVKIVYVDRENNTVYDNKSDDEVRQVKDISDVIIHNGDTLEELNKTAKWFVERFIV